MCTTQVAFAAAANDLNHRKRFKSLFRTLPQLEFFNEAIVQTAIKFQWTQMAVITQTENLFTAVRI